MTAADVHAGTILEKDREYHHYYQWIVVILIVQAILFVIPAHLWKSWEGGRISHLCSRSLG